MTYIGMIIDKNCQVKVHDEEKWQNYTLLMQERIKNLITWPGQRIADELICKVVH